MNRRNFLTLTLIFLLIAMIPQIAFADPLTDSLGQILNPSGDPKSTVDTVKLFIILTVLSLAPSFLILTTCFTRIIVVLSFLRNALGTQQSPPNQILIGLALFLTFFVMQPTYSRVMNEAVTPFLEDEINQEEAFERASIPMKEFMLKETREKDLALFLRTSGKDNVDDPMDLSLTTIVPAFAISELRMAFSMGFIIYIPFLVIDMVVASILMSMGMFMLPPVMISLPFKILLFVLVDGWYLVVESLLKSLI
ncbi:flagellar type III secretion system pore protein FliP [Paratissierella segnis]|nr:flagellar type III secretion system pore protein FliP [Paratissierella segnis]